MRVLDVVHGVVARLPRRDRQVEVERAVVAPHQEREARGVAADLLEQFVHQHELAPPLRHAHGLTVAQQSHELDDEHLVRLGRVAERLQRGLHAGHVAMVIGTEQVDDPVGGPELHVVMERHVDRRVGQLAVRLAHDPILVVAERGRAKPERAVGVVTEPARRELCQHLLREALVADVTLLGGPDVELDPVVAQDPALRLDDPRHRVAAEVLDALALGGGGRDAAALGAIRLRQIDEVLAGISVLGEHRRLAELLAHAYVERARQRLELVAGVVDVELRRNLHALRAEQPRQRVADGGGAGVDDHQRTRRVGGDELETDAPTGRALGAAVRRARRQNLAKRARAPRRRQEHVEESGPRDLEPLDLVERGEILHDEIGDLARRPLRGARQDHGNIGRVVAVLGLARDLPRALVERRQARLRERGPQPVGQRLRQSHRVSGYSSAPRRGEEKAGRLQRRALVARCERRARRSRPRASAARTPYASGATSLGAARLATTAIDVGQSIARGCRRAPRQPADPAAQPRAPFEIHRRVGARLPSQRALVGTDMSMRRLRSSATRRVQLTRPNFGARRDRARIAAEAEPEPVAGKSLSQRYKLHRPPSEIGARLRTAPRGPWRRGDSPSGLRPVWM